MDDDPHVENIDSVNIAPRKTPASPDNAPSAENAPDEGTQQTFRTMELSDKTHLALEAAGYTSPTPIQAGIIPQALTGQDILGQAQTGTGKTAAFAIPIIERIQSSGKKAGPRAIVLVPTRELAVQVSEEFLKLSKGRRLHTVALYGGKPIRGQIEKLKRGVEIVVGTPGRVLDHMGRGTLLLQHVSIAVLDEADRMLDIGFRPDIEKILRRCPKQRQTLLLSATVPPPVKRLAQRYMQDPEVLDFSPRNIAVATIEQFYFTVIGEKKFELLRKLLEREQPRQAIIFCRTKRGTDSVHRRLSRTSSKVACIHGDLAQNVRDRVMGNFRQGKVELLVATDVVGRGIDVSGVSHIINYDCPSFCDDYVHRVGRTGRMGREGIAFTFITPEEGNELTRIEMRINSQLKRDEIEGFESGAVRTSKSTNNSPSNSPNTTADGEREAPKKKAPPRPSSRRTRRHRRAL